jgi:Radical SAM superfamily
VSLLIPVYGFYPMEEGDLIAQPLASAIVFESARLQHGRLLNQQYDFSLGMFYSVPALLDAVRRRGPGVCLFSNYVWNVAENIRASRAVKELEPRCVTIHGGPSTPKYPQTCAIFLLKYPHVDIAVRGEGEATIVDILDNLAPLFSESTNNRFEALQTVKGITFMTKRGAQPLVRTPERPILDTLDEIPSPYLSGFFGRHGWNFDHGGWNKLGDRVWRFRMLILETNRGCPYGCTFCDWGSATLQKIRLFSLERVRAELEWMAQHGAENIYIADANFGILARDLEIAGMIADLKMRYGFPATVTTNFAKNGCERLNLIFRRWASADIAFEPTVSIQSTDVATLHVIRRSNIKSSNYFALSDTARSMNLPTRVQLMFGLPGSTLASWKQDLQLFFDRFEDIQGFKTQLLPNSPMADPAYMMKHGIRSDKAGYVVACKTFTEQDHQMMERILHVYQMFHNFGLMKWFLRCFQWEQNVQASDYMHACASLGDKGPAKYPMLARLLGPDTGQFLAECFTSAQGWSPLYSQVKEYTIETYNIEWTKVHEAALTIQESLMPVRHAPMPRIISLEHDFVTYMTGITKAISTGGSQLARNSVRFDHYPPAALVVTDPHGVCQWDPQSVMSIPLWSTNPGFQLDSVLRELRPSPAAAASSLNFQRQHHEDYPGRIRSSSGDC